MNSTYTGTYTTTKELAETLTIEKLREAIRSIPPCPFEEFANKHGFSLDGGDYMIIPEIATVPNDFPERKGVVFSRFAENIYLAKATAFGFGLLK